MPLRTFFRDDLSKRPVGFVPIFCYVIALTSVIDARFSNWRKVRLPVKFPHGVRGAHEGLAPSTFEPTSVNCYDPKQAASEQDYRGRLRNRIRDGDLKIL